MKLTHLLSSADPATRAGSRGVRQRQGGAGEAQPFFPAPQTLGSVSADPGSKNPRPSAGGAKGLLCMGRTWRGQEQTCPGMCLPGQGHLQALFWVSLGLVTCVGVSVVLPSIPEQEQFPASPAASWWEREERLNLQSREEEFSLAWCPGEQQPRPTRCDAGELVRRSGTHSAPPGMALHWPQHPLPLPVRAVSGFAVVSGTFRHL